MDSGLDQESIDHQPNIFYEANQTSLKQRKKKKEKVARPVATDVSSHKIERYKVQFLQSTPKEDSPAGGKQAADTPGFRQPPAADDADL